MKYEFDISSVKVPGGDVDTVATRSRFEAAQRVGIKEVPTSEVVFITQTRDEEPIRKWFWDADYDEWIDMGM